MTFDEAYETARPFTLCSREKCEVLWQEAQAAPPGDLVEVGVYKGGSAMILQAAAPRRWLHIVDTFTGHPSHGPFDTAHHYLGRYSDTSRDEVLARLDASHVRDWPGDVEHMRALFQAPVALAHIDVDLYESTKAALEIIAPLLVPRGVIVVDDYGEPECPGVTKAVDELLTSSGWARALLAARCEHHQLTIRRSA